MASMLIKIVYNFLIINTCLNEFQVFCQSVPSIACPNYFQYLSFGNTYIGKITLYGLPLSTTKVEAEFSQRAEILTSFSGRLSLYDDLQTTQANLQNGRPISYRVDFPNSHILPKLIRITVNEVTICADQALPPPSTIFKVHHIFYPSTIALSRPVQSNLFENPFVQESIYNYDTGIGKNVVGTQQRTGGTTQSRTYQMENGLPINPFIPNRFNFEMPKVATNSPTIQIYPAPTPTQPPQTQPPPPPPPPRQTTTTTTRRPNIAITCGQEGSNLTPFVVGGNEFERGKFPWLTAIYQRVGADLKFICGGSLVSTRTIITAAHCFMNAGATADRIVVYLGRHNLYSSEFGVEQRDVETLLKHPEFNTSYMSDADLAILQMRVPVSFTQYIAPICLSSPQASIVANQVAYVAGWGSNNEGLDVTPTPKVVEVNIVSENECLRSSDFFRDQTSSRSLCAGKRDGTGPCVGDSGGGLMTNTGGRWNLRAIVSLGLFDPISSNKGGGCNLREYVVYCDITKHMTWIRQNMLQ